MNRSFLRYSLALCATVAIMSGAARGGQGNAGRCRHRRARRAGGRTPSNIALGDSIFNNGSCQNCHGKGGVRAANAPALDGKAWVQLDGSFEEIVGIISMACPPARSGPEAHARDRRARRPHGDRPADPGRRRLRLHADAQ
jgi:mono/diheme cytochrome c family protein